MTKPNEFFPLYSKNETNSTATLFEARKKFEERAIPYIFSDEYMMNNSSIDQMGNSKKRNPITQDNFPISDLYSNYSLYGSITDNGQIIYPVPDDNFLKAVGVSEDGRTFKLQDFVAEALMDMMKFLKDKILKACVSTKKPELAEKLKASPFFNFQVKKSFTNETSMASMYSQTAIISARKFTDYCNSKPHINMKIVDYKSFCKEYVTFLKINMEMLPATASRVYCHYFFNVLNNTLCFSIADDTCNNDEKNYEKYFLDIGLRMFAQACTRFGFRFDKRNPFILHADLSSPNMKEYYKKKNLQNPEDVFAKRFREAYRSELSSLKLFFLNSYTEFIQNNNIILPDVNNICINKLINNPDFNETVIRKSPPTLEEIFISNPNTLNDKFWIRSYLYLKINELRPGFDQNQFENIYNQACSIFSSHYEKNVDLANERCVTYINSFFDEFKSVEFYKSLLEKKDVLSSDQLGKTIQPDIIF